MFENSEVGEAMRIISLYTKMVGRWTIIQQLFSSLEMHRRMGRGGSELVKQREQNMRKSLNIS